VGSAPVETIMKKTPVKAVKEQFSSKEQLVAAVQKLASTDLWLDRVNEAKGLARVSNAKLLRLHAILTAVKKDFGSRAKLIDAILTLEKRAKDAGYKTRLEGYPLPRLVDIHSAASRRAKRASAKTAPAKKAPAKKAKSASASA
jgi:hypothetical protein